MHKVGVVAIFMSLIVAFVVAFQVTIVVDETQPGGTGTAFLVTSVDTPSKDEARDAIADAAREFGVNIFKVQPDPGNSTQGRILFAFIGDEDSFESRGGFDYQAFSERALTTRVALAGDITTEDLRGRYVTSASSGQLTQLLTVLGDEGIVAEDDAVSVAGLLIYSSGQGNLAAAFVIMVIALGLAIFYSVARNRKVHAVRVLHGYRGIANFGAEVVSATRTFVVGLVGLLVVVVPALGLYNLYRQGLRFFAVLGVTMATLLVMVLVFVVVAVFSLPQMNIPQVLKGQQVSLRNGVLAAVAQIAILAIVLATTTASLNRMDAIQESLEVSSQWTQGDPLYALRVGVTGTREDDERAAPPFHAVVTEMERAGQVLLASYGGLSAAEGVTDPQDPDGKNSLLVNNEYLDRQVINDADGQRIADLPTGKNHFTLLVPSSYGGDTDALLQRYVDYFGDFACPVGRDDDGTLDCDPQGVMIFTAPGQEAFTYEGISFQAAEVNQEPKFLPDPVIAVVAADSDLIAPILYFSYASQDNLLFSNPDALDDALRREGISSVFQGIDNAADAVETARAESQRALRMDAFSLPLGWAVLVLASVIMAMVYSDRRKRPMFVQLIHGYSFISRHWRYLVADVLLSVVGIGIGVWLAGVVGGRVSPGLEVAIACVLIAVKLAISVAAVRVYESKFRADIIKQY